MPVRAILDLLAPTRCLACRRRGPLPWCDDCAPVPRATRACPRCGAAGRDGPCPMAGSDVARVIALHDYRGTVAAAVRTAKLEAVVAAYVPLGRALGRRVAAEVATRRLVPVDVVTSVPVPTARRRRRGFDHAALLADEVAAALDREVTALLAVRGRAPDRGAGDPAVPELDPVPGGRLADAHVLLVDDVVTTGATVRAAASVLVTEGARRVTVATVARAGSHVS